MTLLAAVETYVRLKQSLGAVFSVDARILAAFVRAWATSPSARSPRRCAPRSAAVKVRRRDSGHANTRLSAACFGTSSGEVT
jgi:hypothetical protein